MGKEKGLLYSIMGAIILVFFLIFAFFYIKTITGQTVSEESEVYLQGMPLILLSMLFFAGWFLVVLRKKN